MITHDRAAPEMQWRRPGGEWQTGELPVNKAVEVRWRDPFDATKFSESSEWDLTAPA